MHGGRRSAIRGGSFDFGAFISSVAQPSTGNTVGNRTLQSSQQELMPCTRNKSHPRTPPPHHRQHISADSPAVGARLPYPT